MVTETSFSRSVLHVYSSWTAGGAEKLMLSLAAGLEKKGVRNIVACPGDSYMFKKALEYGLKAYPLVIKGSFAPFGLAGLRNIVLKENIDIIQARIPPSCAAASPFLFAEPLPFCRQGHRHLQSGRRRPCG